MAGSRRMLLLAALAAAVVLCAAGAAVISPEDAAASQLDTSPQASAEDALSAEERSLLMWGLEHSDPKALAEQAQAVRAGEGAGGLSIEERKARVRQLSDLLSRQKSETELMQEAIAVLADAGAGVPAKAAALASLQVLVEPIDKANDLQVLGGIAPLLALVAPGTDPALQEGAAFVIGTAASNNEKAVDAFMRAQPQLVAQLLQLAASRHEGAAVKGAYALGALVRSAAPAARRAFFAGGGLTQLQALLSPRAGGSPHRRVKAKALALISDLIELTAAGGDASLGDWDEQALGAFAGAALNALQQSEALHEKEQALAALRAVLAQRGAAGAAALAGADAELVLREALTELDLLTERRRAQLADAQAAARRGGSGARGGAAGVEEEGEDSEVEQLADQVQFAAWVASLCAELLHHLSIQHAEL